MLGSKISSQDYGLFFNSNQELQHQRTGLDLAKKDFLNLGDEFEIRFDLLLRANKNHEFGYILRIVGDRGNNIDIIYDHFSVNKNDIVITFGQKFSSVSLNIEELGIQDLWESLSIKVDLPNNMLTFSIRDTTIVEEEIGLYGDAHFKFLFGANDFNLFETKNVPPMNIRDIKIFSKEKLSYHWPLRQNTGNYTKDEVRGKRAVVSNPVWLITKHMEWAMVSQISAEGRSGFLYRKEQESIEILSGSEHINFSLTTNKLIRVKLPWDSFSWDPGYRLFQDHMTNGFYIVNAANGEILEYHEETNTMEEINEPAFSEQTISHHNAFHDTSNHAIFVVGGFDGMNYLNKVQKFDLHSRKWQMINTAGEILPPRYLAAMEVNNAQDTIYILGGYGSESGSPILNPHFYSDLYSYSIEDSSFSKIYEYENSFGPNGFANSMVIDATENCFYALLFNPNASESTLQLIKGSFEEPVWELMADRIPYTFMEEKSYADLYYSKQLQRLFAITSEYNDFTNLSEIRIYSLFYPPGITFEKAQGKTEQWKMWIWLIFIIAVDIILIIVFTFRNRILTRSAERKRSSTDLQETGFFSPDLLKNTWESKSNMTGQPIPGNRIYLFGGFQFHTGSELELSNKFSPVLKELFLLILIHSSENGQGISTKNLIEQIWGDMSLKNAKNNLSVNINKLRALMGPELGTLLKSISSHWKFDLEGQENLVYCDYWEVWKILRSESRNSKDRISNLIQLIHRGGLLLNTNYEWMDSFKARISNEIIDLLSAYSTDKGAKSNPDFIIKIADTISMFDMINEQAMELKCKALLSLGKHSMAKDTYNKFVNEYLILYDVPYHRSLKQIIE